MDLHTWITQQIDERKRLAQACTTTDWRHVFDGIIVDRDTDGWQHAPDNTVIARVDTDRIYWSTSPAHSPEADHIAGNDPDTVLRRCESDRRILARHRLDPAAANTPHATACDGCGADYVQDHWDPVTDNLNDCPELLDLAHAHGITPDILAKLDRPQPPQPAPRSERRLGLGDIPTAPITTSDIPAALRGHRWKP
ncbi:DUF6221 family protein [Streptomyces sp. ID05-04B]|uniref:DUF6221 family protein n=1 Tax=Streptomyces sp. ID05-04B TaxID=3028661 RepID=UPI0029C4EA72|nr:DUF6221 family protein [Streptomyces sp. ID05-04B]MDX5563750.1 DUF6221 family protein [Streptomyces sp. ID05-04B]